jgi:hypothetical protein
MVMSRGCLALVLCGCAFHVAPVDATTPNDDLSADDLAQEVSADLTALDDLLPPTADLDDLAQAPDLVTLPTVTPILMVSRANSPGSVNLTTEGMLDWEHYGLVQAGDVNRKAGITPRISHSTLGTTTAYGAFASQFSWSDGTPTATANNTNNGVYIQGTDNGFTWVVPADTTQRTFRLYVGEFRGTGTLVAHLSDGSIADVVTNDKNNTNVTLSQFTVAYRATKVGTLTVSWRLTNDAGLGSVDFLAATNF